MTRTSAPSRLRTVVGYVLLAVGVAVFAVRLVHAGPYAMPGGANLFGELGSLLLGAVLLWPGTPRALGRIALVVVPVVLFFGLYATFAELEETVSLYATDAAGKEVDLRLWIVDRDDGAWVGMGRAKAEANALDGARARLLRNGEIRCVVPKLYVDLDTVRAIHAMKLEKYAVARGAAAIGLYPREGRPTGAALRLDPCPT